MFPINIVTAAKPTALKVIFTHRIDVTLAGGLKGSPMGICSGYSVVYILINDLDANNKKAERS